MVDVEYLVFEEDVEEVHKMILKHYEYTASKRAEFILNNWSVEKENVWKIIPGEFKKALAKMAKEAAAKKEVKEVETKEVLHG